MIKKKDSHKMEDKKTFFDKLIMTLGLIIMFPMLFDSPETQKQLKKEGFWKTLLSLLKNALKEIWSN